jgi:hypothetical protein
MPCDAVMQIRPQKSNFIKNKDAMIHEQKCETYFRCRVKMTSELRFTLCGAVWCGENHERSEGNPAIPKTGSVPERVREGGGSAGDCGYRP